jgi:uncharacterized protein YkwD
MSPVGFPAAAVAFLFAALTAPGSKPSERGELLRLVNAERESRGLALLRVSPSLTGLAQTLAEEEASGTESARSALLDRARRVGYEARLLTQITATANGGVEFLFSSWRERRGTTWHDVLREDFRDAGLGTARRDGSLLAVLLLGLSQADDFAARTLPLADAARVRAEMLGRVNSERRRSGVGALRPNPLLDHAAQRYADRMVEKGFYGHTGPEGDTVYERVQESGYRADIVSENLARGQFSVTEVMKGWMGSETHRRNILSPLVREAGFGLAKGKSAEGFQVLWVQMFARPRPGNAAPWPRGRP